MKDAERNPPSSVRQRGKLQVVRGGVAILLVRKGCREDVEDAVRVVKVSAEIEGNGRLSERLQHRTGVEEGEWDVTVGESERAVAPPRLLNHARELRGREPAVEIEPVRHVYSHTPEK